MGKLFTQWIATLNAWEEQVTDFPHYPDWLNLFVAGTWSVAGASLVLALGFLLLVNSVPGLVSLLSPLQALGEILGYFVAGIMILASMLFLLFLLHAILVLFIYTVISLQSRSTLRSLLAVAHRPQ